MNLSDGNAQLDDQGFVPFGIVRNGLEDCVEKVYSTYNDSGKKPDQRKAKEQGNEYFKKEFPLLSSIVRVDIL